MINIPHINISVEPVEDYYTPQYLHDKYFQQKITPQLKSQIEHDINSVNKKIESEFEKDNEVLYSCISVLSQFLSQCNVLTV